MKLKPVTALAAAFVALALFAAPIACRADTVASLLGNFTINQFCEVAPTANAVVVHFAVVFGQLPALRELHQADADGDGITSQRERDDYVGKLAPVFAEGLQLIVDGNRVPLRAVHWSSSLPTEQGGFSLRVDVDFAAPLPPLAGQRTVTFSNDNYAGRMGWHEIVVVPAVGAAIFGTDAYDTSATGGLTEALQALPDSGPLDERSVHLTLSDVLPAGAAALGPRPVAGLPVIVSGGAPVGGTPGSGTANGTSASGALGTTENAWITRKTRQLVDAISAPRLEPRIALWALLAALLLGAVHALSPGHGKTIVGAYLIGSRGTPRHALFLGFTVTVTHTIGVFVLGFATLYASRFIVPERLFPILSLVSALMVLGMGLVLLVQRGRAARQAMQPAWHTAAFLPVTTAISGAAAGAGRGILLTHPHAHSHAHSHTQSHAHSHAHDDHGQHAHADGTWHSHGGGAMHSHLPPGAAGERITWRSLLTLGISGGLVPCPSAMVLLLAAIALNKTAYGMLLVLVFSLGLAITLTVVGLAFLYARNRFGQPSATSRWAHALPVMSAMTITLVGGALCFAALQSFR